MKAYLSLTEIFQRNISKTCLVVLCCYILAILLPWQSKTQQIKTVLILHFLEGKDMYCFDMETEDWLWFYLIFTGHFLTDIHRIPKTSCWASEHVKPVWIASSCINSINIVCLECDRPRDNLVSVALWLQAPEWAWLTTQSSRSLHIGTQSSNLFTLCSSPSTAGTHCD